MVTPTPDIAAGSGTVEAIHVVSARFVPKMVSTIPGAKAWRNDAPFARPVMAGGTVETTVTWMAMVPVAAFRLVSPL